MRSLLISVLLAFAEAAPRTRGSHLPESGVPLCAQRDEEKCGGFIIYLAQRGTRLCGSHFAATPGMGTETS